MVERDERRRFFRIDDFIGLTYQLYEDVQAQQKTADDVVSLHVTPVQMLERIDKELNSALSGMWKTNPALANVIALLNKKIDVVAAEVNPSYGPAEDEQGAVAVNLSACGIAFACEERFVTGQKLLLAITLRPVGIRLSVVGRVVACEATPSASKEPYCVRLNFDEIDLATQEELIQHVVRRQSYLLGQQRTEQADSERGAAKPENIKPTP